MIVWAVSLLYKLSQEFLGLFMRIRLSLAIAVGLLFCTLAALELPELLTLTDDTSNDFSLLGAQQETSAVVSQSHVRHMVVRQPIVLPARSDRKQPNERARFVASVRTAKESLHLLCTLRT
jgi:hypothetical protein